MSFNCSRCCYYFFTSNKCKCTANSFKNGKMCDSKQNLDDIFPDTFDLINKHMYGFGDGSIVYNFSSYAFSLISSMSFLFRFLPTIF